MVIDGLIPALNEEDNIKHVLSGLKGKGLRRVVLVDNGSTDRTAALASAQGAEVVSEPSRGYGSACLAGLEYMRLDPPDVVLFLDCDGADDPDDIPTLVGPVINGDAEFVVGSRTTGPIEPGALTPVQHFGNVLSCSLVHLLFGVKFTDLGPFRAITWSALERLEMADRDFGWTVEMQAKAAKRGVRCAEVPVACLRRHAGQSKVSGTLKGSVKAGVKILYTIGREAIR
jgi:glycosyltransferase involved in cell wall biosynthesis